MLAKFRNWLKTDNNLLWFSVCSLMVIGIIAMYFVMPYTITRMGKGILFHRYLRIVLMGFLVMLLCSRMSAKSVLKISWIFGIIAFLLILNTVVFPHYIAGSSRYINLFGMIINPFTIMLPAYIVLLSKWLSDENNKYGIPVGVITTLLIVFAAIRAPYMFMAEVYLLVFGIMLVVSRKIKSNVLYIGILSGLGFLLVAGLFVPHIQSRILNFGNYATQMSLNAITHSAIIGNTPQSLSALSRLPGSVVDFTVTSIIAKFGLLFGLLVFGIYGSIMMKLSSIIKNSKDKFGKYITVGTLTVFAMCLFISFAMSVSLISGSASWPFLGFNSYMYIMWCMLFGFVLATNKE